MKHVKILCVCGSGTVSSAMVANKLTEKLADHGYDVQAIECSPNSAASALALAILRERYEALQK